MMESTATPPSHQHGMMPNPNHNHPPRTTNRASSSSTNTTNNNNGPINVHPNRMTRRGFDVFMMVGTFVDIFMMVLGPLLILLATSLISFVIYVFFYGVWGKLTGDSFFLKLFHITIDIWLMFNVFYNYYSVVRTKPGSVPDSIDMETGLVVDEVAPPKGEGFTKYCKRCKKHKPERAHHCHICKKCVLRMDHHCPWIHNCVGHFNHRYFVLFLFYMWVGCLYVGAVTYRPFFWFTSLGYPSEFRSGIVFSFVISMSVCMAISLLLGWHIYLVLTNQTTIEFYYNRNRKRKARMQGTVWENEFDLGPRRNWEYFFGCKWYLFWIPNFGPTPGDGVEYPKRFGNLMGGSGIEEVGRKRHVKNPVSIPEDVEKLH